MLHSRAQRVSDLFKNDKGRAEVVGKVGRDAGGDAGTTGPSRLRPRSGRWLEDGNQVRRVESKRLRSSTDGAGDASGPSPTGSCCSRNDEGGNGGEREFAVMLVVH